MKETLKLLPKDDLDIKVCAEQMLFLLIDDLGYKSQPRYGAAPVRHFIAWDYARYILGSDRIAEIVAGCENDH